MDEQAERRSCEERLPDHLESRLEDLRDLTERMQSEDAEERERAREEAHTYGLGLQLRKVVRWDLSTGGTADWLEFHVSEYGKLDRVEYVLQDWWDVDRQELVGEDYETARQFFDRVLRPFLEARG